jgi:acetyl esterase/lipase
MSTHAKDQAGSNLSSAQYKMYLQLIPKLPLAARVALFHMLSLSEPSKYVDLRTEVIVAVLRSFLAPSKPLSITTTQKLLNRDPGIKGRIWVSTYAAPVSPGTGIRDAMIRAIEGLQEGPSLEDEIKRFPQSVPIEAEWTGYRAAATEDSRLPAISEQEKYAEMMKEVTTPTTVLYFHGGAYYLMDPASHRPTTKVLAKLTGGRCYSVRYRLAPQNPFPAAVMDALLSYLALLYPPPGAFHAAVKPEHIVIAGDSAGANLSLALLQTLLELNRQSPSEGLSWHGQTIPYPLPLPAGLALNSPWLDMTHSFPSTTGNAAFDYLPSFISGHNQQPKPACEAWPAKPPRKTLYVDDALIAHPLSTLVLPKSWRGAPPMYICTGWELLADEDKYLATKLVKDGVKVVFEEFQAMPHCFAMIFNGSPGSRRCFEGWTGFMKSVTAGEGIAESRFVSITAKTLEETPVEVGTLSKFSEEEVRERVKRRLGGTKEIGGLDEAPAPAKL